MNEVSCRVFDIFFRPLEAKGISAEKLVDKTGVSLDVLRDKGARISWTEFVAVMHNVRRCFDEAELVAIGRALMRSPATRFAMAIARMLFSPTEFYAWTFKPRSGVGNQWFTCVEPSCRVISATRLELTLTLAEGYEPCEEFFVISKGNFIEIPALLGYSPAEVELESIERGARYWVSVPQGSSLLTRIRRALHWPFTARTTARELKDAHEELQLKFEQLDATKLILDRQARQLRTAHVVSDLIHGELDLDRTLDAIARALVEEAGFAGSAVEVKANVDGVAIDRLVEHGERGDTSLIRQLDGRAGQRVGEIRVYPRAGDDRAEREELLTFIEATIAMAVDNAISYLVVEEYRRGLEKRVEERTAELSQARDELASTVQHLEQMREGRERIFASVNHELRTPLSLILLAVTELRSKQNGSADPDAVRALEAVEHAARRLLRMVDDLLLLAEGREGDIKLWIAPCDLSEMVARVVNAWKPAANTGGLTLEAEVAEPCVVRADRDAIERILTNLISNALKFTPKGGRIDVRLVAGNERAWLEVRDTGVGIDDELRQRLFGRFERGRRSVTGKISGSGLGLSLVKELVEQHDGTVDVESLGDGGTLFRVGLPLAPPDIPLATTRRTDAPPQPEDFGIATSIIETPEVYEARSTPIATLLLAEDDGELRDRIARLLSLEYRVIAAPDGDTALLLARKYRPDLLVTDLAMPGMDGIELTRQFRKLAGSRVAPVLLLTAAGSIGDRLSGFEAGAVDYILKPFEPAELRARVRSQLALRNLALQLLETEKLAALGTLSAGLAHEMRNPANGIINALGPLQELLPPNALPPGSDAAELMTVVEKCSAQIAQLSRQLLGFRRGAKLDKNDVVLETMLRRVRAMTQPALEGVELRERLAYRGAVKCAEPLLAQVFSNLLDNAAHAAGRGGWVEVRSEKAEDRVVVEFEDSGPGVPTELRERIFDPFFTTKPPGSGTGLGLSTARDIMMQHGGSLGVHGAAGRTVFRIELPLTG